MRYKRQFHLHGRDIKMHTYITELTYLLQINSKGECIQRVCKKRYRCQFNLYNRDIKIYSSITKPTHHLQINNKEERKRRICKTRCKHQFHLHNRDIKNTHLHNRANSPPANQQRRRMDTESM